MLTITNINNNANSIRVYDHRTQYNKNGLLYAAERVKDAKHANINRRGGRIALSHNIGCNGVINHKTPRKMAHKLFIDCCIDEYGDGWNWFIDGEYYENIIVIGSCDFAEINNSEYGELYDTIKKRADELSGEIIDIIHGANDYYDTIPEAVADMLDIKNITGEQADAVKNAAAAYWNNKISFNEYAAELLTALTPHKWNCCTLRGYCQGDWINILYPTDIYSRDDMSEYECYFFGMYYEYNARYNGETMTAYYSDNYTADDVINRIADYFNAGPDQIIFNFCY